MTIMIMNYPVVNDVNICMAIALVDSYTRSYTWILVKLLLALRKLSAL